MVKFKIGEKVQVRRGNKWINTYIISVRAGNFYIVKAFGKSVGLSPGHYLRKIKKIGDLSHFYVGRRKK